MAAISHLLATRRFTLLVKILQWNRKIQYSNYLVQSSFSFGVGTAFPHLFWHYTPEYQQAC